MSGAESFILEADRLSEELVAYIEKAMQIRERLISSSFFMRLRSSNGRGLSVMNMRSLGIKDKK